ncbi:hypothetical protein [Pendulispora albinea]|uniref:Cytochrome c domain-containing protein n=1 Tax=Pendulispora albinea TaxID=2741071 RepID=A0ABZ2LNA5_9BACT
MTQVILVIIALCAIAGCAPKSGSRVPDGESRTPESGPMSSPEEYGDRPISAEAGADYFLRLGGGDPYATGMAYPLFLALMEAYPGELGRDWNAFAEKFGMISDPEAKGDPRVLPIGFHLTVDPKTNVPWLVANCQFCHAERIRLPGGDRIVPGMGNKSVRPHAYGAALVRIGTDPGLDPARLTALATQRAAAWNVAWPEVMRRPIVDATLAAFKSGSARRAAWAKQVDDALPGRTATIESFAFALGERQNQTIVLPSTIGWVKTPDVRGFPFRETFSYDASGYGSPQALVLEADFLFGTRAEWYLSHPHIATSMYLYLKSFTRKLPFPKPVDEALARRGKGVFEARCAECHGFYVDHGDDVRVSYRERVIPLDVIGTDPARVKAVTADFVEAANRFEMTRGYTRVRNTNGYVPPVLIDVWARGVFGHAGQWPSLEAMATRPDERPRQFIVDTRGLYDLERVGVRHEIVPRGRPARPLKPGEYLYNGDLPGFRTDGHPFLSNLPPADRLATIEYLKTLSAD